jgi:hypothetical protein
LEERPGLLIIPRGIRQPLLEQLTRRRVSLAEIVKVEWGGRVVVWELHGRVHVQCLLCARKDVSSSILPEARYKSTPVQVSSNCVKVPMESDIDMRQASSPPLWARTSLPSVSGVLLVVHDIDTCLLASQVVSLNFRDEVLLAEYHRHYWV